MYATEKTILLICRDTALADTIGKRLLKQGYTISRAGSVGQGIVLVYESPPELIMIHEPLITGPSLALLKKFKRDNLFSHIPVMLLVSTAWAHSRVDWNSYPVEDYVSQTCRASELYNRVTLCRSRFIRALDPNPLTRLPGNTSILRQIQQTLDLGSSEAICYLDVDNFKAYNDTYGFARGDEALRMTARILSNVIRDYESDRAFVGHVGGDDFVFIVPAADAEDVCRKIIASFDRIVPSLYDPADREQGGITARDRRGKTQRYPLMSISIAVVRSDIGRQPHYGAVSELASQVKKEVKKLPGSNYLVNRRQQESH